MSPSTHIQYPNIIRYPRVGITSFMIESRIAKLDNHLPESSVNICDDTPICQGKIDYQMILSRYFLIIFWPSVLLYDTTSYPTTDILLH